MTAKRIRRALAPAREAVRILGIDPSLSGTGYAYRMDGQLYTGNIDPKALRGPARLHYIRMQLHRVLAAYNPQIVVYEDYAMSRGKAGMVFHIGELGGVLKHMLWENGIDVMLVTPTQLKMVIAGHGHAEKYSGERKPKKGKKAKAPLPNMRDALHEKFGYLIEQADEADAFGLLLCGELRFGREADLQNHRSSVRMKSLADCPILPGKQSKLKLISNKLGS